MIIKYFNTLIIFALIILHFFDGGMTMYLVYGGFATEINPIMKWALQTGPLIFIFTKGALSFISVFFAWALRESFAFAPFLFFMTLGYCLVALNHVDIFCRI